MKFSGLASRVLVALTLGPLVLLAAYFGGYWFIGFVALIAVASYWEFSQMALKKEALSSKGWGIAVLLFFILNLKFGWMDKIESLYITILVIMFRELFKNKGSAILNIGASITGIFYIGVCSSSLVLIREYDKFPEDKAGLFIIGYIVSIWLSDTSAYFGGVSFGKHRLLERVSPKKSWEGALGNVLGNLGGAFLMRAFVCTEWTPVDAIAIGLLLGLVGQLGDLVESTWKRSAGVKDSNIGISIPGHGGMLDRVDSLVFAAPVLYAYVHFVHGLN